MSISAQYCFNTELNPAELVFEMSRRLGCVLNPVADEPETFQGGFFGIHLTLYPNAIQDDSGGETHVLVNDGDLNFEDYRYVLSNKTWAGQPLRPIQIEVMALIAYFLHDSALAIHQGMLVFEVGYLLARYENRDEGWFDIVSNRRVTYPEHLVDVKATIDDPKGCGVSV